MDIDGNTLRAAVGHVDEVVQRGVTVHTVTLITNGHHGGVDLRIEGHLHVHDSDRPLTEYVRDHVIR